MSRKHDHAQEAIDAIDKVLADPPIGIDEALEYAVARGNMTIKEAEECREAYYRTFHGIDPILLPITDDDTLATPVGHYQKPPNLWR